MVPKEERMRKERRVYRECKKAGGREEDKGLKIKRDKQRGMGGLVGGGRGVVPQRDHSWCLTPLVLLMCDAQEIDRLCKTQPTGENNNNTSQTQGNGNSTGLRRDETTVGGARWTAAPVDVTFTHSGKGS